MKCITFLFVVFILAVIVLANLGILPRYLRIVYDFPNGDKVGHFILFGLLNFLLTLTVIHSLPQRTPILAALLTGVILAVLIALEEFSQLFFARRSFDLIDLSASLLGVLIGGWTALKLRK